MSMGLGGCNSHGTSSLRDVVYGDYVKGFESLKGRSVRQERSGVDMI